MAIVVVVVVDRRYGVDGWMASLLLLPLASRLVRKKQKKGQ